MANPAFRAQPADGGDSVRRFAAFDAATLYEAAGQKGMVDPSIRPAWPGRTRSAAWPRRWSALPATT